MTKPIAIQHELDAAWIIALWKAIHNGDPTPEQIALEAISALSSVLVGRSQTGGPSFAEFQGRLKDIGVDFQSKQAVAETHAAADQSVRPRTYCVHFQGQLVCITLKTIQPPPHK